MDHWNVDVHFVGENQSACFFPFLNKDYTPSSEYGLLIVKILLAVLLAMRRCNFFSFLSETVTWVEFHLPVTDFSNYALR